MLFYPHLNNFFSPSPLFLLSFNILRLPLDTVITVSCQYLLLHSLTARIQLGSSWTNIHTASLIQKAHSCSCGCMALFIVNKSDISLHLFRCPTGFCHITACSIPPQVGVKGIEHCVRNYSETTTVHYSDRQQFLYVHILYVDLSRSLKFSYSGSCLTTTTASFTL